ncbi:MAG: hypothetical protein JWO15_1787 [Sphingomonadales bacterium]|nr:hypothetical protein [Sphingomonadales bacterium]
MTLKVGTRLKSAVCTAEAIIIRPPDTESPLACGGALMTIANEAPVDAPPLTEAQAGQALIGKRYVDEISGLEVLCTKGGQGALTFDGRLLALKEAKPLPASD